MQNLRTKRAAFCFVENHVFTPKALHNTAPCEKKRDKFVCPEGQRCERLFRVIWGISGHFQAPKFRHWQRELRKLRIFRPKESFTALPEGVAQSQFRPLCNPFGVGDGGNALFPGCAGATLGYVVKRLRRRAKVFYRGAASAFCAVIALVLACGGASAQEEFEDWHLEPGVSQAHLVMVARVASISRLTVVEGAKTDVAIREYRFQPIRRLKGIFQRDQLSMTAADLGCPADDAALAPPLKEGEFRLLILAQQQGRYMGCVSAAPGATTFGQRVPLLTGPDDPLVAVVETLIQVADARSRRERATLLVNRLEGVDGRQLRGVCHWWVDKAAVPILSSLRLRADWAATDERALPSLTPLVHDPSAAVRGAALEVLRDILASRIMPKDPRQLDRVADALSAVLNSDEPITRVRLAALEALGHLLALKANVAWSRELLISQLTTTKTHAERAAAATALSRIAHPQSVAAVLEALAGLPLDEQPARVSAYARAAVRLDGPGAQRILLARLQRSIRARQSLEAEIEALGRLRSKACLPLLLAAAGQPTLAPVDRHRIAWALGRLGDDRAVPVLTGWLRGDDYQLKDVALAALENLDSQLAAREARPLLKSEAHLPFKLRLARLLARHELADGYALATEHLADVSHTAEATLVLAALDDARTAKDLSAIVAARPDRRWHAAALAGLAATGDATARRQLLVILADDRHPLAADAAEAAGLAGDADLLRPLATLVQSRNRHIALASLVALRRFYTGVRTSPRGLAAVDREDGDLRPPGVDAPAKTRAAIVSAVASLVVDAYVEADVRQEAFAVARLLRGEHYAKLLADVADQAELEGTPLLAAAEAEMRRQRGLDK
jgi:HEAT repeat protein